MSYRDGPKSPPTVPRAATRTDPAVNRSLVQHEARRLPQTPDEAAAANRQVHEHEARRRASMVDRHEKEMASLRGEHEGFARFVLEQLVTQNAGTVAIARHLRIAEKLPPELLKSVAPPPPGQAPPNAPKLDNIEKDAKQGAQATYVTLASTILLIVLEALRLFGHGGH